jgi:sugar phosphate isomerase/epimerase
MKFAICNETFNDRTVEAGFEFARKCGYTGIEIAPFTLATYATEISPHRRAEVRQQAADTGLEVIGLHWLLAKTEGFYLTSPDIAVRRRTSEYLGELARLCRDLGGSLMVLGSPQQRNLLPGVTKPDAMRYAADCIQGALAALEENEVVLCVEPLGPAEGDFLLNAKAGIRLAEMVGSPHCKLHLDVKAMSSEGRPIEGIIRDSRDWMVHFHANDPNLLGPGMGDVDFRPIFAALKEVNYNGWISVEVFKYEPSPDEIARRSMEYMRRTLAEV